jgi:hypothetical protein
MELLNHITCVVFHFIIVNLNNLELSWGWSGNMGLAELSMVLYMMYHFLEILINHGLLFFFMFAFVSPRQKQAQSQEFSSSSDSSAMPSVHCSKSSPGQSRFDS